MEPLLIFKGMKEMERWGAALKIEDELSPPLL
jgi:hypothetical protein